jgi:hypothetical protein
MMPYSAIFLLSFLPFWLIPPICYDKGYFVKPATLLIIMTS